MAFSYSLHLSAKSHAVTNVSKIKQVSRHNTRAYESKDYDRNQIEVLIGSDNILEDMQKVYHEQFDVALEQYNEGKRSDRQIPDYLKHVSDSRSDVGAEMIIQVGDQEFWADKDMSDKKKMSEVFRGQLKALEKYCFDFKVASAIVHYDEKSPHMHVVGVPVASGYKKGLEVQCAKTKIFTKESLSILQDVMRADVERSMAKYPELFSDKELKAKEKGRNHDIPKKSMTEFRKLEKEIIEKGEELYSIQQEAIEAHISAEKAKDKVFTLQDEKRRLQGDIKALQTEKEVLTAKEVEAVKSEKTILGGLKGVSYKDFEAIKNTAMKVDQVSAERDKALARAKKADQRADNAEVKAEQAYAEANRQLRIKIAEVEKDRPSLKMRMENIQLRQENQGLKEKIEGLEETLHRLVAIIREKLPEIYRTIVQPKQRKEKAKMQDKDWER